MSQVLQEISKQLVFPIDYPSQAKLTNRTHYLIIIFGIISFIYGYLKQSIYQLLICYGIGIIITGLIIIPSYPSYNKQKLEFVKPKQIDINIIN